ncbi:MAG: hypothetical protein RL660_664 [Bacteroidota bacterium]|jgi:beta-lactam-binding protein with PASTA domain
MLKRSLLLNILLIIVLTAGLLFAFFKSLHSITKHGQEAKVPNVTGHQLKLALKELDGFELQIDSIYVPYRDPLEIIYQEPAAGQIVKKGRIIFLSVNKLSPPTIAMPKLVDLSFRNAVLTLTSYRLIMGDTIFKPDLAAGAVLQQLLNGKEIAPGTQVPLGSRVSLVVGAGLSDSTMSVPDVIGKSWAEARSILTSMGIEPNVVWDGSISDSQSAIIYEQFPESKNELDYTNYINAGELMDLRVMQSPSEELLRMHRAGSQRYIDPNDTNVKVIYGPLIPEEPDTTALPGGEQAKPRRKPKPKDISDEIQNALQSGGQDPADVPPSYDPKTATKPDKPSADQPKGAGQKPVPPSDKKPADGAKSPASASQKTPAKPAKGATPAATDKSAKPLKPGEKAPTKPTSTKPTTKDTKTKPKPKPTDAGDDYK